MFSWEEKDTLNENWPLSVVSLESSVCTVVNENIIYLDELLKFCHAQLPQPWDETEIVN